MALLPCKECGRKISSRTKARACPGCGAPIDMRPERFLAAYKIVSVLLVVVLAACSGLMLLAPHIKAWVQR